MASFLLGNEIIPIVLYSRPIGNFFRDAIPWCVLTIYPTGGFVDMKEVEKRDIILVTFNGTEFFRFKYKQMMEWKNLDKLINKMNSKFKEADKKANSKYSILGEKRKSSLEKTNAIYFNVLQNERTLRKDAHNGDDKAFSILRKFKIDDL